MVGKRLCLGIALLLAVSPVLLGQVAGSLSGSVVDASGAPIAGATIHVYLAGGNEALFTTKTAWGGLFTFAAVRPGLYDISAEATGFARHVTRGVNVAPIKETVIPVIRMEIAVTQQVVEVGAEVQPVQTKTFELSTTVTRDQIQNLPVAGRQVSNLYLTQAGVTSGRGPTVINGLRTSMANVTLDGINIQDNFIRTNSLDYMPMRTTIDQISEVTIAIGNNASSIGGGAAQIALVTRAGSNEYHGALYLYNRNNKFSANDWFNNRAQVQRPFLNLNQVGGSIGGRIIRDKLLFFVNYEAYRLRQQSSRLRTVLTPEARRGIFSYISTSGAQSQVNLLGARQTRIDPTIVSFVEQLPLPNTTDTGDGLNTSGLRFNARSNSSRNQLVYRGDYYMSSRQSFSWTYNYAAEKVDRPDLGNFYSVVPPVFNDNHNHLTSLTWRSTISARFTNELRGGFNLGPGVFNVSGEYPSFLVAGLVFTTPQNRFLRQGRDTDTYSIQDNASWIRGRHEIAFGYQSQYIRTVPFNDGGTLTDYTIGVSPANTTGFTAADLPAARAQDVSVANSLYASLAGIISRADRSFHVKDRTSGFAAGFPEIRHFRYDTFAGYVQDRWRIHRRLVVTLGLRYEYWVRLNERDGLFLVPRLVNNNPIETLLSNATLDFAGGPSGPPYYNADRNNLAPNAGFSWDLFGDGRTALRGGYTVSYVNDDMITAVRNNIATSQGLSASNAVTNLTTTLASAPQVPAPGFKVPRTQAENFTVNRGSALGLPDPNLRTPYVQQFSFGIQREAGRNNFFELRYVGNHGTKLIRAFDVNQVIIRENGFLDDFIRARNNGFLALSAVGRFDPSYSPNIAGSQQLPVFARLAAGGLLTNATIQQLIRQGEPGSLADTYYFNNLQGAVNFYRNPVAAGTNIITNGADSTYHALQFDYRRDTARGLYFQFNYTFSKVLSNGIGDDLSRFEPYLDLENPGAERARAPFDLTHAFKANGGWELPFGRGKRWSLYGWQDRVFGGWVVSGIWNYTSGTPFSIFSERGTVNRAARSNFRNTATSLAAGPQLKSSVGPLVMTGNGPLFVAPGAIGTDGRGTSSDGSAPFNGQFFYNPQPGTLGALQRRMFSGPWNFDADMALLKRFYFRERQHIELRAEAFNVFNTPSFWVGNESDGTARFNINQPTFGRITGTFTSRRLMQFGLYYRF
jgi:hypothetical protein